MRIWFPGRIGFSGFLSFLPLSSAVKCHCLFPHVMSRMHRYKIVISPNLSSATIIIPHHLPASPNFWIWVEGAIIRTKSCFNSYMTLLLNSFSLLAVIKQIIESHNSADFSLSLCSHKCIYLARILLLDCFTLATKCCVWRRAHSIFSLSKIIWGRDKRCVTVQDETATVVIMQ